MHFVRFRLLRRFAAVILLPHPRWLMRVIRTRASHLATSLAAATFTKKRGGSDARFAHLLALVDSLPIGVFVFGLLSFVGTSTGIREQLAVLPGTWCYPHW